MTVALCPGSFDPPTNGHLDVVERAARHFEHVIVAVVTNPHKAPLFEASDRVGFMKEALEQLTNVEVIQHDGLTVDLAGSRGVNVIVKGLRAVSDMESELQQAQMNASLAPGIDTLFIATNPRWSFLSSSLIKEVARYGGPVSGLVPVSVEAALRKRFAR